MKKIYALLLCVVMLVSFCAGALAVGNLEEIKAFLNYGITVKYNGEVKEITDATGVRTYPITYNGTTYVPIRSVSNLIGIPVDWDGANNTVLLGENPESEVPAEKVLSRGTVNGQIYENRFVGIGFNAPSTWTYLGDEEIGQLIGTVLDMDGFEDLQEFFEGNDAYCDVFAVGEDGNVNMTIEKKTEYMKAISFEEIYEETTIGLEEQLEGTYDTALVTKTDVTVDGKNFYGFRVKGDYQGTEIYQRGFMIDLGDYVATITVSSTIPDLIDQIIGRFFVIE